MNLLKQSGTTLKEILNENGLYKLKYIFSINLKLDSN